MKYDILFQQSIQLLSVSSYKTIGFIELFFRRKINIFKQSGNLKIELSQSLNFDTKLVSTTGIAELDFNGNPLIGIFSLIRREDGEIDIPTGFELNQQNIDGYPQFQLTSFNTGTHKPNISIKTTSGKAVLKR